MSSDPDDARSKRTEAIFALYKYFAETSSGYIKVSEMLGLPEDVLANMEDTDFLLLLKSHATLEPLVREAVISHFSSWFSSSEEHAPGRAAIVKIIGDLDFDRRRKLAVDMSLINQTESEFIDAISKVRNRYAHHIVNASLSIEAICEKIADNGPKNILEKLAPKDYKIQVMKYYDPHLIVYDRLGRLLEKLMVHVSSET